MYSLHTKIALIGVVSMALLYVVGCNKQQDTLPIEPKQVEILTADPAVRIIIFNAYDNRGVPRFLESYLRNRVQNIVRIELREDWYAKSNYIKNSFSDGHTKIVVVESEHRRNAEKIEQLLPGTQRIEVPKDSGFIGLDTGSNGGDDIAIFVGKNLMKDIHSLDEQISKIVEDSSGKKCGDTLATHNGVNVYRNYGKGMHSCGDYHRTSQYDYGPKWQCVEFIRRYYSEHLSHQFSVKGHAKEYFDKNLAHGQLNPTRGLIQYKNGHDEKPQLDDLLVCQNIVPKYGHVAIIKSVEDDKIQVLQQNMLPAEDSYALTNEDGKWVIDGGCTGFLRKER